jgi:hypothetical protein
MGDEKMFDGMYLESTANERGNVLIVNDDGGMYAFIRLGMQNGNSRWMQINYIPDNYPSLNVDLLIGERSDAEFFKFLRKFYDGWTIRKMNLDCDWRGSVENDIIIGLPTGVDA